MDTDDVIIKFIVTYYCPSACSIHRNGEAIVHAQTACHKLKPRLLLCYVTVAMLNTSISLCLSHWTLGYVTKSRVLFIVREDNLRSGLTSVG